jgi:MoxR-like ATPase
MKISLGYPSPSEEREIVHRMGVDPPHASQVLALGDLATLQRSADAVYVDHGVVDYAVSLVLATREPASYGLSELTELISFGASPRASLALVAGARALALLRGRTYALPQDVFDVAPEILRHRLVLSYEALAQGRDVEQVLIRILSTVPAPRITPSQDPTRNAAERAGATSVVNDAGAVWGATPPAPNPSAWAEPGNL